jgi:protein-L-isoaspartate(D-aspartate) O-methyltransferase
LEKEAWEKLVDSLMRESILRSPNAIRAMRAVPRVGFLPENMKEYGADDTPLPIGMGQTISAPHSLGSSPSWAKHGFNNE